jgi:hypothetical protein
MSPGIAPVRPIAAPVCHDGSQTYFSVAGKTVGVEM